MILIGDDICTAHKYLLNVIVTDRNIGIDAAVIVLLDVENAIFAVCGGVLL